jgi:hypothetical protein
MKSHQAPPEDDIVKFVEESNRIEGILRPPTPAELEEFKRFLALEEVTVEEMEHFVSVYQPGARLRDKLGLDVRVGGYLPPRGSPQIRDHLVDLLYDDEMSAHEQHVAYEALHPFTDGNGRSGRMLWAWRMKTFPLGFLHSFYYQTLDSSRH